MLLTLTRPSLMHLLYSSASSALNSLANTSLSFSPHQRPLACVVKVK